MTRKIDKDAGYGDFASRGVSTWKSPAGQRRIFLATIDAHLIAVDAATGKPCADFGKDGMVDLRRGLRIPPQPDGYADYEETSPPAIVGDTVVVGSGIADNGTRRRPERRGARLRRRHRQAEVDLGPDPAGPEEPGRRDLEGRQREAHRRRQRLVGDRRRSRARPGLRPHRQPQPRLLRRRAPGRQPRRQFGRRPARRRPARRVWSFQTVHHDLWDYDVASPPVLFDVHRDGQTIPAVGVGSKTGNFFILDRETGEPVFGVEERPVPKSDVAGETASAHAAVPRRAAAARAADDEARRDPGLGGRPQVVPRADREAPQRRGLHPAQPARARCSFPATSAAWPGAARPTIPSTVCC